MRILILANSMGGLYKFRRELVESLLTEHEVVISAPVGTYAEDLENMGCRIINADIERHGTNPLSDLNLLNYYRKVIKEVVPDVVFTYTVKPNIYGGIACKLKKVPFFANITGLGVSVENGGILQKIVLSLYRFSLKSAKCVFFQNSSNLEFMKLHRVVDKQSILLPGSGVNLDAFPFVDYPDEKDVVRFLFIGRVMKDKGIDELLQTAVNIKEKYDNVFFDIVGDFDGDYKEIIDRYVNDGTITYHGKQLDVKPFINNSHCIVMPSYHEGMSNVLLEAASSGRPIIATNVPGCRETFEEGESGFGCEVRNADSLTDTIEKFIRLPFDDKKRMGILGRQKMEREFDRKIIIDTYLQELEKISSSHTTKQKETIER